MIRAAAKNHADVAVDRRAGRLRRACSTSCRPTTAAPRSPCARSSPPRPMRAPPPMTPRSPTGSRSSSAMPRRTTAPSAAAWSRRCATARTRTSRRRSIARRSSARGVASARQVQGKQLSYNNINDTDAAYECVAEFDPKRTAACAIIKHANPCGVAEGANAADAYRKALALRSGLRLRRHRGAQPHARRRRRARHHRDFHRSHHRARCRARRRSPSSAPRRTCACCLAGGLPDPRAAGMLVKSVAGGLLVQSRDNAVVDDMTLEGRDQARADRCRAAAIWRSRSASPST